jgi:hypothetical protein
MSRNEDPWIVTDEKMPCFVLAGKIEPAAYVQELQQTLDSHMAHVSNVYNCRAFALNRDCTTLFCVKRNGCVAFVILPHSYAVRDNDFFGEYTKELDQAIIKVRRLIDHMQHQPSLILELVSIEMTGRQPN